MGPKDADVMVNSVDPDQTAPVFAWTYLSENLESLQKFQTLKIKWQIFNYFSVTVEYR